MPETPFDLLNRHVSISRETFDRLSLYNSLLAKWQSKINLVGSNTMDSIWERHFLDSLQLLPYLGGLSQPMVDLGSGGGFPGLVLAIAGATDMHLVESDGRKVTFLEQVALVTKTRASIHHTRIEEYKMEKVRVVISRACAPLDTLLGYSHGCVSHETICLFPKGKNYSKEIEEAKKHWLFDCEPIPSITDGEGAILKIAGIRGK